jgi:pilus assembly protein CpaB
MARTTRPLLLLALALVSGGLAAYLALRYIRQQATPVIAAQPRKSSVILAARSLPLGAIVGPQDIKTIEWSGNVPAGYLSTPEDVVGRGLVQNVQENEAILTGKLAAKGAGGGLPVIIDEGMRAVSIAVDQVVGVAGFVLPSTRVDVLLTMPDNATKEPATRVIMQDVRTLAAGQSIQQDAEGKAQVVSVVTMLVSPEQAETLALASQQGRIQLALRNTLDTARIKTTGTRAGVLMGSAIGRIPTTSRRGAAVRASAPQPTGTVVEIYRGGVRTLQKF